MLLLFYGFRIVKYSRSQHAKSECFEYPTTVKLRRSHNHSVSSAAALRHRDIAPETRATLVTLFQHGHTVASALQCLKTDLLVQHGTEYFKVAADSRYLPSSSVAQKLFESEFSQNYGSFSGSEMFATLEAQLEQYNQENSGSEHGPSMEVK